VNPPSRSLKSIRTHYDLLGVRPDATAAEIRQAYRNAARANHPDVAGGSRANTMAAINEAWSVLGDPARRREYDRSLPSGSHGSTGARTPQSAQEHFTEPRLNPLARYQDPPRFPWRLLGVMGLIGVAFILLGVATASEPRPPTVDNVLRPGDCVVIGPNGDAAEVLCSAEHDGTLVVLVSGEERCPDGTAAHRDRKGMGTACVQLR
jgi:hypothetical protein